MEGSGAGDAADETRTDGVANKRARSDQEEAVTEAVTVTEASVEKQQSGSEQRPAQAQALGTSHSFRRDHTKFQVVIGVSGSVAAIKLPELVSEIIRQSPPNRVLIRVVATDSAVHFFDSGQFEFPVYRDRHEWELWTGRGAPILHIELRRWADLLLIAPLDANTLAKIANGLCDNLLSCLVRAWDPAKPLYFCPAMNTYMLEHPLTFKHLDVLKNLLNYNEIPSVEKDLMCGDKGYGAMAPVPMIASVVAGEVKKRFAVISRS